MFNQKKHSREESHTGLRIDIAATREQVHKTLLADIVHKDAPPILGGALYAGPCTDDLLVFAFGNKLMDAWLCAIMLEDREAGCHAHVFLDHWIEQNGTMNGRRQWQRFREDVLTSLRRLDPGVQVETTYEQDKKEARKAARREARAQ